MINLLILKFLFLIITLFAMIGLAYKEMPMEIVLQAGILLILAGILLLQGH